MRSTYVVTSIDAILPWIPLVGLIALLLLCLALLQYWLVPNARIVYGRSRFLPIGPLIYPSTHP